MTDSEIREWFRSVRFQTLRNDPSCPKLAHKVTDHRKAPYHFLKYVYEEMFGTGCSDVSIIRTEDDASQIIYYIPLHVREHLTEKELRMFWDYGVTPCALLDGEFIQFYAT